MKTLFRRQSPLSQPVQQIEALNASGLRVAQLPKFADKLGATGLWPLAATRVDTLQINVGKMCNQVCTHCHVDAGPDRTEIMTRQTMESCLQAIQQAKIKGVDLTGGAPEMNPDFRWFVAEIRKLGAEVIVRSNLTILMHGKAYEDMPQFFADHQVTVVSSLPCYGKKNTDGQRGVGVFDKSIQALLRLNAEGYGKPGSGLILNLVYNPSGAFLPGPQAALEADYKRELKALFDIDFNHLYTITNLPISRFLDFLLETGELEAYLEKLVGAFNPAAAAGVMCRNLVSVSWDGFLYDCDFNQMLEIPVTPAESRHIRDFKIDLLEKRSIVVNQHCFGCTAGAGSSCVGVTTH
jgi:radical SAM/Cys-rich protein